LVSFIPNAALVSILTIHILASSTLGQTTTVNDSKVITDARAAYYNLTRHGFNGCHATIEPNWKVILGDTATPENLKIFRSQRFSMSVDARGVVTVNREFDLAPSVKQIHEHLQNLVTSFFRTWAFFMIGSPFPELQIRIENLNKEYRLFYAVQPTEVTLFMTRDFLITEAQLSDSSARRIIKPVFQKTPQGFLLRGYHTSFELLGRGNPTTIDTTIEYNDIRGIKLPGKIHIQGMYVGKPVEAELKFNEYELIPSGSYKETPQRLSAP